MTINVVYRPGGFDPALPHGNADQCWDADAGTYTRWDGTGEVAEERPLSDEELADLASGSGAPTPDLVTIANDLAAQRERLAAAEDALFYLITDSLERI